MDEAGKAFLDKLLATSSPTGCEQRLQRLLRDWAEPFADLIDPDAHGNLAVVINPGAERKLVLAGHCDQIGFMVMEIDRDGFVRVDPLGGIDEQTMAGAAVVIQGRDGDVPGVFGKTATHNQKADDQKKTPEVDELWIDIGAKDREEAESLVSIGAYATYTVAATSLRNGRLAAPGIDNAAGVWAIMETARRCAENGGRRGLGFALYCVSTVQEEIGSRGAETACNRISPDIAIAVDTTLALDDPSQPKRRTIPPIKLDAGPSVSSGPNTNPVVERLLLAAADRAGVRVQREPRAEAESNDAKPMQLADGGAAAASVGIPIRNMHTQNEVVSLRDIEGTAAMLTEFVRSLRADVDLLPINVTGAGDQRERARSGRDAGGGREAVGGRSTDHDGRNGRGDGKRRRNQGSGRR